MTMAAPSIPNLLTTRGGGPGRGGRGGRGGRAGWGGGAAAEPASADAVVQDTDTDAAVSRLSAVDLGYLDDAYAPYFVAGPPTRRLPIINRGTYMRTRALAAFLSDTITDAYAHEHPRQIISLGAGSDTRPFRLLDSPQSPGLIYHEIDFEPTCRRKYGVIRSLPALAGSLHKVEAGQGGSWSARSRRGGEYHCHAVDLRDMHNAFALAMPATVRPEVPTLVLSECCLCYLTHQDSERVLNFFHSRIADLAIVIYEPMPLDDAFGKIMVANLKARNISMPSLQRYKDQQGQEDRLREAGFEAVGHATIEDTWEQWVDSNEKERLDALEGLDEVEEWRLLAAHYVVTWGTKGTSAFGEFGRRVMAKMG